MKIIVGSKNKVKVDAVKELLQDYPHLAAADVEETDVPSGVADQPKSLEETVEGAMNRARNAFTECDYSIGLESGLMCVYGSVSGHMHVNVCVVHDGEQFHLGLSSAWEAPQNVMNLMLKENLNLSEAAHAAGYTDNPNIGAAEGLISIMTKGRLDRKGYLKEALRMALIHVEK